MLRIRLQRVGRKHEPSFRLVLTDSKNSAKSGRFKEILGSYDPRTPKDSLNSERINYWLSQGASATDTVHNLLVKHRVINAKKIDVSAALRRPPAVTPPVSEPKEVPSEVVGDTSRAPEDVIIDEVVEEGAV
jgi:small subunit ribosomal protein S16